MERHIYIDGRLKTQLDKKIIPDLKKKDKDCVFIVDGKEGSGKSTFAMGIGYYIASKLGTKYDINNICFKPEEFRRKIIGCPDKSLIVYDEAHRGMASARALISCFLISRLSPLTSSLKLGLNNWTFL